MTARLCAIVCWVVCVWCVLCVVCCVLSITTLKRHLIPYNNTTHYTHATHNAKGPLEYGLDYTASRLETGVEKGIEIDQRQPGNSEKALAEMLANRDRLAEWFETFKSECGEYAEAAEHIQRCENILAGVASVEAGVAGKVGSWCAWWLRFTSVVVFPDGCSKGDR
jgi:hypothetical protein